MDKIQSKKLMQKVGLQTPDFAVVTKSTPDFPKNLSLPVIVKPPSEGSTFGITIVKQEKQWKKALKKAFECAKKAIVEKYIPGIETTVGVLDGKPLPLIEIRFPGKLYDYDAKYTHKQGDTLYICPPEKISDSLQKKAQEMAVEFYHAVKARDMLRVDMMIDKKGEIYILEGNSIPGFTASSLLPKAAKANDMSFTQLCAHLALNALKRKKR